MTIGKAIEKAVEEDSANGNQQLFMVITGCQMSQLMTLCYLSRRRPAKAQATLKSA